MMINNPYNSGPPVIGRQFFGRATLLRSILETFNTSSQNAIVMFGRARLGKTSVLKEVAIRLGDQGYVPVYWGLKDEAQKSRLQALQSLSKAIAEKVQLPTSSLQASLDSDDFHTHFLPQLLQSIKPRRLVLLLDDFDALIKSEDEADNLITDFQKLIVYEQSIAFVLSTSRKFQALPSSFLRIFKHVRTEELSFLTPQETHSLITELSKDTAVNYSKAVEAIGSLSAGHPYFTQLICHEIFDHAPKETKTQVDIATVENTLPRILEKGAPDLEKLIAGLSNNQQDTLAACALVFTETGFISLKSVSNTLRQRQVIIEDREVERSLNELQKREVLQEKEGGFRFTIPLLARWIVKRHQKPKPTLFILLGSGIALLLAAVIGVFAWRDFSLQGTPTPTLTQEISMTNHTPTTQPELTAEPTEEPTQEPTVEPTTEPTAEPTQEPTQEPTVEPTTEPTAELTQEPTAELTAEPTEEPTQEPTAEPTAEPIQEPTIQPAPVPLPLGLKFLDLDVAGAGPSKLIYALAKDTGIYRRDINGNWSLFSSGLDDGDKIRALKARTETDQITTLYVSYDDGVRRWSVTDGWSNKFPLPRVHGFVAVPNSNLIFAATNEGVYRSIDDGRTWHATNQRLQGGFIDVPIYSLAIGKDQTETEDWVLYAVGGDSAYVFKANIDPNLESSISADSRRWRDIPCDCGTKEAFFAITTDPTNSQTVYVGNDRSRISFSSDGGANWSTTTVPIGEAQEVFITDIVIAPGNTAAYAATGNDPAPYAGNGVLIRTGENDWSTVKKPPSFKPKSDYVQSIAVDPDNPQIIYVAASNGLFKFDTNTQEWTPSP